MIRRKSKNPLIAAVYRLYPTPAQEAQLQQMLETHRRLYNRFLMDRRAAWDEGYRLDGYRFDPIEKKRYRQDAWKTQRILFSAIRRAGHPYYRLLNDNSAHETLHRLDAAYQSFFGLCKLRQAGGLKGQVPRPPRPVRRGEFRFVPFASAGWKLFDGTGKFRTLRIHYGRRCDGSCGPACTGACAGRPDYLLLRLRLHRPVPGAVKRLGLHYNGRYWRAILSVEVPAPTPRAGPAVGIDLGLKAFLVTSDGVEVGNPRPLKGQLRKLRRLQRAVSRKLHKAKAEGRAKSARLREAVRQVGRLHASVADLRRDFHHKEAEKLVRGHALVAVEKLNIRGLARTRLGKHVLDVGWGAFQTILKLKCAQHGVRYVEVDPRGTTQECSGCGAIVPKDLKVRIHACPYCGLVLDRDHNAARRVLQRALGHLPCLAGVGPLP